MNVDEIARSEFPRVRGNRARRVSWTRLREWLKDSSAAEQLGFKGLSSEIQKSAFRQVEQSGIGLTEDEFVAYCELLVQKCKAYPVATATTAGMAAGGILGGPIGAAAGGLLGAAYASVSPSTAAGAILGGVLAGPVGLVAGAAAGSSAPSIQSGYLGEPDGWTRFDELRAAGESERREGPPPDVAAKMCGDKSDELVGMGLAVCGSGGGLRAATAFLALIAELEQCGYLEQVDYAAALSGSCWSLTAWYAEGRGTSARDFVPEFGKRLEVDIRAPHPAWVAGSDSPNTISAIASLGLFGATPNAGADDDGHWVYSRFAARCEQGHAISVADVWGAHLAERLLPLETRRGGFGVSAFKGRRPLPLFTAVEARANGPEWTKNAAKCERCGLRPFGKILGWSRHHCRACGKAVCESCSASDKPRRCRVCFEEGITAPIERTRWVWWEISPNGVGPVGRDEPRVAAHRFGRNSPDEDDVEINPRFGGEPIGFLLGVFGSAFCATVERFEGSGTVGQRTARVMRAIADPASSDPAAPLLQPAGFHHPFQADARLYLGDAGFASNLPLPPLLGRPDIKSVLILDASSYPVTLDSAGRSMLDRSYLQAQLDRTIGDAKVLGAHIRFDLDAFVTQPISFHFADLPAEHPPRSILLIVFHLAKLDPEDDFCPLLNSQQGGFCSNATASYKPAEYHRLVDFVRAKFRRHRHLVDFVFQSRGPSANQPACEVSSAAPSMS